MDVLRTVKNSAMSFSDGAEWSGIATLGRDVDK